MMTEARWANLRQWIVIGLLVVVAVGVWVR